MRRRALSRFGIGNLQLSRYFENNESSQAPARPAVTLGNMRQLGVHYLIGFCRDDACRHTALIVLSYLDVR